jgi:UDP-N-acetylmuramoyl-tripeptide--D-alanyl-D-alanine ligase
MADAPLWTWHEICKALGLEPEAGPDVAGLAIDSRRITPGDLFVALPGDPGPRFNVSQRSERDGHDFIEAAIAAGAVGVLAHDGKPRSIPQLQTQDTLDALWQWAQAARRRLDCPVVAITGSSGKTTTKGLMSAALHGFATPGSLNNHIGVPLSLIATPADAKAAIFEIGTNHPGEIAPLAQLVRPDVAVVLNVHPAHAEFFIDLQQLTEEKLSIHKGLSNKGHLVVEDLIDTARLPAELPLTTFGRTANADVRLLALHDGLAEYQVDGATVSAVVPGGGMPQALCLASILAVLRALGRDPAGAANLPADLVPAGRGDASISGGVTVVDDSYNANPESMKSALRTLASHSQPTLAVLGDMLELGADSARYHIGLKAQCADIDAIICVGPEMARLYEQLPDSQRAGHFEKADEAALRAILDRARPGHRVLVKGSNRIFWARNFAARLRAALDQAAA